MLIEEYYRILLALIDCFVDRRQPRERKARIMTTTILAIAAGISAATLDAVTRKGVQDDIGIVSYSLVVLVSGAIGLAVAVFVVATWPAVVAIGVLTVVDGVVRVRL